MIKWNSVKDELPEQFEIVITYNENGFYSVCEHSDGVFRHILNDRENKYPSHWKRLPHPPPLKNIDLNTY